MTKIKFQKPESKNKVDEGLFFAIEKSKQITVVIKIEMFRLTVITDWGDINQKPFNSTSEWFSYITDNYEILSEVSEITFK